MANKRDFKKYAEALGASVCEVMMIAYYDDAVTDKDSIERAIVMALGAVGVARKNSCVSFDKGPKAFDTPKEYARAKKDFYKKLFDKISNEFNDGIESAVKLLNSALPQSLKDEQKKAVAS